MKISFWKRLKIANLLKNPDNITLYRGSRNWTLDLPINDKKLIDWLISICKASNIRGKRNEHRTALPKLPK